MKNYYELINMFGFDNISAIQDLTEDFKEDFSANFHGLQFNKTTREKACKKYTSDAMQDKALPEVFSDGHSIISIPGFTADKAKKFNIGEQLINFFKNQKPVDLYIKESVAVARSIGWKSGTSGYFLNVDGNIFNFDLVYKVFSCIADPDTSKLSEYCYLVPFCKAYGLLIRTQYGIGVILPINATACDETHNVNFKRFTDVLNTVDAELVKSALKTA